MDNYLIEMVSNRPSDGEGSLTIVNNRPPLTIKRRNFLVLAGMGLFDLILGVRLVDIQAIESHTLKGLADSIHFRSIPLAAFRGNIVDRNGRLLAGSHHAYSLYVIPVQARRQQSEALLLSSLLNIPEQRIMKRLRTKQGFVWLKRRLSQQELDQIQSQMPSLPGVHLVTETTRYYPEGSLAGPVLGFTGIDNQGLSGLELVYDKYLVGKRGSIQEEYDATGRTIQFAKQRVIEPTAGDTLMLSLDENIQWMAERACERAMITTGGRSVSILIMHVKTGGILAMAQRPSFNPNRFRDYNPKRYRELSVSDAIPPGSIFKPVTLAAAMEDGVAGSDSGFFCPGFKNVLGRRVNCWRPAGHGPETLADVVKNSCNVGFMQLGLSLGVKKFYRYLELFGLTSRTHIDLPGEALGIFPKISRVTALDLAVMAFGQTLTVTPIGLLTAVSAIANGGELLRPHVGQKILGTDGKVIRSMERTVVRRVISPHVAGQVQNMMVGVVSQGTGKLAQVPGYRVAGKTGTAQKVVNGRVEKGIYIASFIGYAPVPDPEVAVLVSVDEPQGAFYGGQVAAPIFSRVMKDVLRYLNIRPTEPIKRPKPGDTVMVPDLVNLHRTEALQDAEAFGFPVQFTGQGDVVVQQSVEYGGYRPAGTVLTLTLGRSSRIYLEWVAVPKFVGLSFPKAHHLARDIGLNLQRQGNGTTVYRQSLHPGHEVRAGSDLTVWLG